MNQHQFAGRDERFIRRYDYDGEWIVAADLDVGDDDVSVDVVGQTAIVVLELESGTQEAELQLPGEAERIDVNNGVLTIVGNR